MILDTRPGYKPNDIAIGHASIAGKRFDTFQFCCPAPGCYFIGRMFWNPADLASEGEEETHHCPTSPEESDMPTGKSIIEKLWDRLDELMDLIMSMTDPINKGLLQNEARGIAYAIHLMSTPYFQTIGDVSRESVKRYKMRHGLIEKEPTPGVKGYNPPPIIAVTAAKKTQAPKSIQIPKKITDSHIKQIKNALSSEVFSESEIMDMYSVTKAELELIKVK